MGFGESWTGSGSFILWLPISSHIQSPDLAFVLHYIESIVLYPFVRTVLRGAIYWWQKSSKKTKWSHRNRIPKTPSLWGLIAVIMIPMSNCCQGTRWGTEHPTDQNRACHDEQNRMLPLLDTPVHDGIHSIDKRMTAVSPYFLFTLSTVEMSSTQSSSSRSFLPWVVIQRSVWLRIKSRNRNTMKR